MIREAYPGASGVALDAADALDEACVEIARLRAAARAHNQRVEQERRMNEETRAVHIFDHAK